MNWKKLLGVLILVICAGVFAGFFYCIGGWKALQFMGGVLVFVVVVGAGIWLLLES